MSKKQAIQVTPRSNVTSRVKHARAVVVLESEAANDAARYVRVPERDTHNGPNSKAGFAWRDTTDGAVHLYLTDFDPNQRTFGYRESGNA